MFGGVFADSRTSGWLPVPRVTIDAGLHPHCLCGSAKQWPNRGVRVLASFMPLDSGRCTHIGKQLTEHVFFWMGRNKKIA